METLSKVKYVVFDKTGTMTQGVFEVAGIHRSVIEDSCLSTQPSQKAIPPTP